MAHKCSVAVHDNAVTSGYFVSASSIAFFYFFYGVAHCTVMKRCLTPLSFVKSLESGWFQVWNSNEWN